MGVRISQPFPLNNPSSTAVKASPTKVELMEYGLTAPVKLQIAHWYSASVVLLVAPSICVISHAISRYFVLLSSRVEPNAVVEEFRCSAFTYQVLPPVMSCVKSTQ